MRNRGLEEVTISPFDKPSVTLKAECTGAASIVATSQFKTMRRSQVPALPLSATPALTCPEHVSSVCSHSGPIAASNVQSLTPSLLLSRLLMPLSRDLTSGAPVGANRLLPPKPPKGFCTPVGT